jgi:hypothetical protein
MATPKQLKLIRATPENGLFASLKKEWNKQFAHDDAPVDSYRPMMEHAERISAENPQDKRYGIFVLVDQADDDKVLTHEGLVHINHALPRTTKATLRLVWSLIAPHYAYEEIKVEKLANISAGFLIGSLRICGTAMQSRHLRIYLGTPIDRQFAMSLASHMGTKHPKHTFAVAGSWMHLSLEPRS